MSTLRRLILLLLFVGFSSAVVLLLSRPTYLFSRVARVFGAETASTPLPPIGALLDPMDGLWANARQAATHPGGSTRLEAAVEHPVRVVRDQRGVPHIFAGSERDAVIALGYVTAQDRLFQMDFLPRVASGRLAELLGEDVLETDRFLRSTGMLAGARRNLERIRETESIERDLLGWYSTGVNLYIESLDKRDYPVEFKLLGHRPQPHRMIDALLVLQYMAFDLSYETDSDDYAELRARMNQTEYEKLFPRDPHLFVPIVRQSEFEGRPVSPAEREEGAAPTAGTADSVSAQRNAPLRPELGVEGFVAGKGSNNWAVSGSRSTTGAPILAGDMHLAVRLPSIWYEAHVVTPETNVYGVLVPGSPIIVEGFNDDLAWAFTNTGADQIDHYTLELDAGRSRYRYEGAWRDLTMVLDTIFVRGAEAVVDTLRFSHHGPLARGSEQPVAIRWTAHEPSQTLLALRGMQRARSMAQFQEALQHWDTPAQNILVATRDGDIAIRSTGYIPLRASGDGIGLLDGATAGTEWVGRIPFDDLPYALNPDNEFLASTNQAPVGPWYPYYLNHDWRDAFRSLRIDSLLSSRAAHSVSDIASYQADVHVVQRDLFAPMLDSLRGLDAHADSLRSWLLRWDGAATTDRFEPLVLEVFLDNLSRLAWDEFEGVRRPGTTTLLRLLGESPQSEWLDIRATQLMRETAGDLLRIALRATADSLEERHGWDPEAWRWGARHRIRFDHYLPSIRSLGRGPYEFPGFRETLSPARNRLVTHSASWRMVVDFSTPRPTATGIYPGGQSGNPFSLLYDAHIPAYLEFHRFGLLRPETEEDLPRESVTGVVQLVPAAATDTSEAE